MRNNNLDKTRFVCSLMVVLIHLTAFIPKEGQDTFGNYWVYRKILSLAVPVFFSSVGLIYGNKPSEERDEFLNKYKKSIFNLFLTSSVIYCFLSLFNGVLSIDSPKYILLNWKNILNGTWGQFHLWYLWGLYVGLNIFQNVKKYISNELLLLITIVLYGAILSGDFSVFPNFKLYNGGFVTAMLYFLVGYYSSKLKIGNSVIFPLLFLSFIAYYYFSSIKGIGKIEYYQIIVIFFLMALINKNPGNTSIISKFNAFGENIYIYHVFVLNILESHFNLIRVSSSLFYFDLFLSLTIVCLFSIFLGYLCKSVTNFFFKSLNLI